jgi:hypothetical protein
MNTLKTIALSSVVLLAAKVQAQINIPVSNVSLDYSLSSNYAVTLDLAGTSRSVYVDPFKIASTGLTGSLATTAEIAAIKSTALWFCMDPLQTIAYGNDGGSLVYQSITGTDFNKYTDNTVAQALNPSYNGGLNTTESNDLKKLFTANYVAASTNSLTAAALQIAIWEVVNESNTSSGAASYQLTGNNAGNFSITGYNSWSLISSAQSMLNALANYNAPFTGALDFLIDGTYNTGGGNNCSTVVVQDFVGWAPPIPEPSTYGAAAVGLLGLAIFAKRRSQKVKLNAPAA